MFETLIKEIQIIAKRDTKDVRDLLCSLTEEVGEIGTAILVKNGKKKRVLTEGVEEEAVDAALTALAIVLQNPEWDAERLASQFAVKLRKWKENLDIREGK